MVSNQDLHVTTVIVGPVGNRVCISKGEAYPEEEGDETKVECKNPETDTRNERPLGRYVNVNTSYLRPTKVVSRADT